MPRLPRKAAAAIFVLALGVRLAAIAAFGFSTLDFGDARAYVATARALAGTGHYPLRVEPFFFRPPGYPYFLAIATLGHPDRIALAKIVNTILGAFAAVLLAAISRRVFRRTALAIATGLAAAVHPSFVLLSTEVQSEPLFLVLLLAAGWLLLVAADRPSSNLAAAAGGSLALAALTRSTALALAPLLLAPLADRRLPRRARAHLAGAALLGFAVTLTPWTIRNALAYRELLPVSDAGGYSLYHGNSHWTKRYYAIRSRAEFDRWITAFDADMKASIGRIDSLGTFSPGQRSALFAHMAIDEMRADPAGEARLIAQKTWQWIRPYPTPWFWPPAVVAGIGTLYAVLYVLAGSGLATAERRGVATFCVVLLAVAMAIHVALLVVWRYRVPYWDPVLLLYAPAGAARLARPRPVALTK